MAERNREGLLLSAFVTTALACWGFRGFLPAGTPFGPLVLSQLQWQDLVLDLGRVKVPLDAGPGGVRRLEGEVSARYRSAGEVPSMSLPAWQWA